MSKYIKRVNWPWVEIETAFINPPGTMVINVNDITAVWPYPNGKYIDGIRLKDGKWIEDLFTVDALKELQELIMTRKEVKTKFNIPGSLPINSTIEMMHEGQTMQEWLEEEGQA